MPAPTPPTDPPAAPGRWWRLLAALLVTFVLVEVAVALARGGAFDGIPLLSPTMAVTVEAVAGAALVGSWLSVRRRWLARQLPAILLGAALVTGITAVALRWTSTVNDSYPAIFVLWVGAVFAAAGSAVVVWVSSTSSRARRWLAAAAVPLTVGGAFLLVNDQYGAWPTVGDLLDHTHVVGPAALHLPAGARAKDEGVIVGLDPPATVSHFVHRQGSVYLPPAYFTPERAKLPVLVMLPGTPSATSQWPTSGRAVVTADAYATAHDGVAPIMLFVDPNGTTTGDTECVDGPRGNAETYLTVDVRNFVEKTLLVPPDPDRWAVVGFSEGGTCAFDLALGHPDIYRHFVDLAGDARPTLGSVHLTVKGLFGGSLAAWRRHDPLLLLSTHRYHGLTGWFAAGVGDHRHILAARKMAAAASRGGLEVHQFVGIAGHNWQFAGAAFSRVLPQLCRQLGLP